MYQNVQKIKFYMFKSHANMIVTIKVASLVNC
jgi:hypothetical protein